MSDFQGQSEFEIIVNAVCICEIFAIICIIIYHESFTVIFKLMCVLRLEVFY
jgi:hypothetical protein